MILNKEAISIQPGDIVVMSCKDKLSEQAIGTLNTNLSQLFPNNKTVLMCNGDSLEVYREQGRYVDATGLDGVKKILDIKEASDV